jgi:hypothetical protein
MTASIATEKSVDMSRHQIRSVTAKGKLFVPCNLCRNEVQTMYNVNVVKRTFYALCVTSYIYDK